MMKNAPLWLAVLVITCALFLVLSQDCQTEPEPAPALRAVALDVYLQHIGLKPVDVRWFSQDIAIVSYLDHRGVVYRLNIQCSKTCRIVDLAPYYPLPRRSQPKSCAVRRPRTVPPAWNRSNQGRTDALSTGQKRPKNGHNRYERRL